MANNRRIKILRTDKITDVNKSTIIEDGQPFYDKSTRFLYIGQGKPIENTATNEKTESIIAENAVHADDATNVSTNINNKAISSIFESNGITVKNATNASKSVTQQISDNSTNIATTAFVTSKIAQELENKMNKWEVLYNNNSNTDTSVTIPNLTDYFLIRIYYNTYFKYSGDKVNNLNRSGGDFPLSAFNISLGVLLDGHPGYVGSYRATLAGNTLTTRPVSGDETNDGKCMITQVLGMKL